MYRPRPVAPRASGRNPRQQVGASVSGRSADPHRGRGNAAVRVPPECPLPKSAQSGRLGRSQQFRAVGRRQCLSLMLHSDKLTCIGSSTRHSAQPHAGCWAFAFNGPMGNRTPGRGIGSPTRHQTPAQWVSGALPPIDRFCSARTLQLPSVTAGAVTAAIGPLADYGPTICGPLQAAVSDGTKARRFLETYLVLRSVIWFTFRPSIETEWLPNACHLGSSPQVFGKYLATVARWGLTFDRENQNPGFPRQGNGNTRFCQPSVQLALHRIYRAVALVRCRRLTPKEVGHILHVRSTTL
jgi:hypothetical protein